MKRFAILFLFTAQLAWCQTSQTATDYVAKRIQFTLLNPPVSVNSASVSVSGNPGPATYFYWIVTNTTLGASSPVGPFAANNAPNTLSGANFDQISWTSVPNATSYDVLRTSNQSPPFGACNCAVATAVAGNSVNDQANSLGAYTVNTLDPSTLSIIVQNFGGVLAFGGSIAAPNIPASIPGGGACPANQFVIALNTALPPTCATDVLASNQHANQGTTTTVLHGNAAGPPSFGPLVSVDLNITTTSCAAGSVVTSISSGAVGSCSPISPSGTGFLHVTGGSIDAAARAVSLASADVTGVLPSANGGTGQNSTATFPASGIVVSEAATETLASKRITPRLVAVTDATSITPNSDTSDVVTQTNSQVAGTLTLNAPTGTPTDGQKLVIRIKSTNAQTYSFNATYHFSTTVTAPTTLAAGKTDYIGCMWNATNTAWDVVAVDQGH
jgi:hypothetical protein